MAQNQETGSHDARGAFGTSLALAYLVFAIATYLTWYGLGDWDAVFYVDTAMDWLADGPSIGETHWALRYPLVAPIAASMAALGTNEFAATLPNILYSAALVAISVWYGTKMLGRRAGLVLGILVAASPPLALIPIGIEIRGPETFFVIWAFWVFVAAGLNDGGRAPYLAVGVMAGLAWLCREVAAYAIPTLVLSALVFLPRARWVTAILWPIVGFGLVLLGEVAFYTIATGDPAFRYKLDLGHTETNVGTPGAPLAANAAPENMRSSLTVPIMDRLLSPITGAHFLAGLVALVFLIPMFWREGRKLRFGVGVFAIAVAISFPLGALVFNLQSTRYFAMIDYLVLILVALVVQGARHRIWLAICWLGVAALAVLGPIVADAERGFGFHQYISARHAVAAALEEDEPLAANKWIAERAALLLRMDGWDPETANAEFILRDEGGVGQLTFIPHTQDPCFDAPTPCPWVFVRDVADVPFGWTYPGQVWLWNNLPVPDKFRHHGPQRSRIYRWTGAE